MDAPRPARPDGRPELVSRRGLLRLAGSVGLAATVSACSNGTVAESATRPSSRPATSPTPLTASQPAEPVISPTFASSTASAVLLCRDAWGARPARAGGRPHTITRMTIHHTAVVLGDNRAAPARLLQHQQYHQDEQGWIDIAYHVGVDRNGNIYELRTPNLAGDTATSYDPTGHFLVVCEGNFNEESVTEAQLQGAALAFAWAAQRFGIATNTLAGHCDVSPDTACPGANLEAYVSSGGLKRRIDDLLAAGMVDLQRVCGPDAAAIVAAIEAGH
jgi:N-acetylmuramoyl-L-alanine amidase